MSQSSLFSCVRSIARLSSAFDETPPHAARRSPSPRPPRSASTLYASALQRNGLPAVQAACAEATEYGVVSSPHAAAEDYLDGSDKFENK